MANALASVLSGGSPLTAGARTSGLGGAQGFQMLNQYASRTATPRVSPSGWQTGPSQPPPKQNVLPQAPPGVYDLNTDPVLQQIQSMAGQSDAQANASALRQREQLLTGYGDPSLAAAVLGSNDPYVQAAGQNPTSIVAQLRQQHDRQLHDLIEQLNNANLFYSGNRILREQQDANDYQGQLAHAANDVQGSLDTIAGNLASALASNQNQRAQALQEAYGRAIQQPHPVTAPGGFSPQPSDYTSSTQPGTIYTLPGGQHAAVQPSGYVAPAYIGPSGSYVSPLTGAGQQGGYSPVPITADMVAPPDMSAYSRLASQAELDRLATMLFRSARGGNYMV